ncbi:class I SAM-dependent DNA methyltransferase [Haliscomenobacter hydrossis]|uniref:Methyltransferase type 11 n=1 Tax=Haliscomenobacter hydrossis (strain ATCC 27775 / DSM 1100 / LMG 10767 / O) TaxID=760192 RepID=F4L7C0_HALH1|nr:class I SAM-dependent methyltransferase [Haliscomenobacter hydrossis]AEE53147.1 Methyltransferase type 11 [Haliscomenobacter hydrossis DSM 1100]
MNKLYTEYAQLYHLMYQSFIDYSAEYQYYQEILAEFHCKSILEVACGTGQLGRRFVDAGYTHQGLDMSAEMLQVAQEILPGGTFHQQDMRHIKLADTFDAALITARSVSHLLSNPDVIQTFAGIKNVLHPGGILVFDFIDANTYIPHIQANPSVTHEVNTLEGTFKRESQYLFNVAKGWQCTWKSSYYQQINGAYVPIGTDEDELRVFTEDEMELLLQLSGLKVIKFLKRPSYAYDTKVVIAQTYFTTDSHR